MSTNPHVAQHHRLLITSAGSGTFVRIVTDFSREASVARRQMDSKYIISHMLRPVKSGIARFGERVR